MRKLWIGLIQGFLACFPCRRHSRQQKLLKIYTEALLKSRPSAERVSRLIPYLLEKTLKLVNASFSVFNPTTNNYHVYSLTEEGLPRAMGQSSVLIQELKKKKEELDLAKVRNVQLAASIKALAAVLIVPGLAAEQDLVLMLNLGPYLTGEKFSRRDIHYLKDYASWLASDLKPQ